VLPVRDEVSGLLDLDHGGRSRPRVAFNTPNVIRSFDHCTPPLITPTVNP